MSDKMGMKVKEILSTMVYGFALLGLVMFLAWAKRGYNSGPDFPAHAIGQVLGYIAVATIGVLICFTDVIFEKTSSLLRIGSYSGVVYILSLIFFSKAPINPLGDLERFAVYTFFYLFVLAVVCALWYAYNYMVSNEYGRHLDVYKARLREMQ